MLDNRRVLFLLILFILQGLASSARSRPNIIWIVCEDISPFIGSYGNKFVKTPNIDQLAKEGVLYTKAFATAGVCAPSRSAIITSMYQTSIGTHHMRTLNGAAGARYSPVADYSAVVPEYVRCFPEYLRMNGYYCTNNEKQDYQFVPPVTVWDENGPAGSWRNRPPGSPFFSVFNFMITHESQIFMRDRESILVDTNALELPPFYPDTRTVRRDMGRLFSNIERMDKQVGELISRLKEDGLYNESYIFFYSDHGGALPWMKREVLDRGIHIPLIIRFPKGQGAGTVSDDLVSSVDLGATVLSLAGVPVPSHIQGIPFLGSQRSKAPRRYVFAARDRMDTEYDRVRSVRDKRYQYLYNYQPEKPYYQQIEFRLGIPMMKEMLQLRDEGKLGPVQAAWFLPKPAEELYDLEKDPHQLRNLASDAAYREKLEELRKALKDWQAQVGDMGALPEKEMVAKWWNGQAEPPATEAPRVIREGNGLKIQCATKGASIGFRVVKPGEPMTENHMVMSWDASVLFNMKVNGQKTVAPPAWRVYRGEVIRLAAGDTLKINAQRIGYTGTSLDYVAR